MALYRRGSVLSNRFIKCFCIQQQRYASKHQIFEQQPDGLEYEFQRPVSMLQNIVLTVGSAFASVNDPLRSDMVATLAETTGHSTLRKLQLQMLNDDTGCRILKEKPMINSENVNVDELIKLPASTFGHNYAKFMIGYGITSDTRPKVYYIENTELAYIMNRYRQIHDFIHCILGFSITVPNEIVVKWFEASHFGFPMNTLSALFGPLAVSNIYEHREIRKHIPWAVYNGRTMKLLLNVYFEENFEKDFDLFKKELGLSPNKFI